MYHPPVHVSSTRILYTCVYGNYECDAFFPELNASEWVCTEESATVVDSGIDIKFMTYERAVLLV
jgi:hypothetical protein